MLQCFLVIYLLMPLMMLPFIKRRRPAGVLDKETTTELRGLGMWIIVLAHAVEGRINNVTFFFYASAILGVSICFFLSGYGLYKSSVVKQNYLKGFLWTKFFRLLLPYALLFVAVIVLREIVGKPFSFREILRDLIRLQLNGALLWYLKIQLLLYVFFWVAFHLSEKFRIGCLILFTIAYMVIARSIGLGEVWYNTCLFFPIGVICGKYENKVVPFIQRRHTILVALFVFLFTFGVIYFLGRMNLSFIIDPIYMLSFLILTIGLFSFFSGSRLLYVMGISSMEIYLVHIILLQDSLPLSKALNPEYGWSHLVLLACTLIISIPLYSLDKWIFNKMFHVIKG